MKRVLIYVEGQTEETFVRDILAPHLAERNTWLVPVLARTKRTRSGQTFKGGIVSYEKVRRDILGLLQDTSAQLVTTMLDYYGLPRDFPDRIALSGKTPYERVTFLERAFQDNIAHQRFLPYLNLHEFEALVLARPQEFFDLFPDHRQPTQNLLNEIKGFSSPEEINEGATTHPSARIARYIPTYRKRLHGPLIAERVGLGNIRSRCPHFAVWLSRLEHL